MVITALVFSGVGESPGLPSLRPAVHDVACHLCLRLVNDRFGNSDAGWRRRRFPRSDAAALILLGVGREQAAAIAIILHLVDFAPGALFGVFYFLRGDVNVSRLRAMISSSAVEHAVEDEKIVLARET